MVHPGRILGVVMGLVILASIFMLPFINEPPTTLYAIARPLLENIGLIPSMGDQTTVAYAYIIVISFILLVVAGVVGVFPLGTGVLGIIGMGFITLAPFFLTPFGILQPVWGLGFYAIWFASIISLGASFWHGRPRKQSSQ